MCSLPRNNCCWFHTVTQILFWSGRFDKGDFFIKTFSWHWITVFSFIFLFTEVKDFSNFSWPISTWHRVPFWTHFWPGTNIFCAAPIVKSRFWLPCQSYYHPFFSFRVVSVRLSAIMSTGGSPCDYCPWCIGQNCTGSPGPAPFPQDFRLGPPNIRHGTLRPNPQPWSQLVTSGGHHWRPVHLGKLLPPPNPGSNIWWWPLM